MKPLQCQRRNVGWSIMLLCLLGFYATGDLRAETNQKVFAVVTELTGWAIARSKDGEERQLSVGSELYAYETIITGEDTKLVAKGPDEIIEVEGKQARTLLPAGTRQLRTRKYSGGFLGGLLNPGMGMGSGAAAKAPAQVEKPRPETAVANAAVPRPAPDSHLFSAREFLFSGLAEAGGYPLYSYLLFNREDLEGAVYQRRVAAVQGYLELLPPVKEVSPDIAREDINIFYLPLKAAARAEDQARLVADIEAMKLNPLAKHILDNYDFSHARVLLHRANLEGDGPFIVTTTRPLSENNIKPEETVITQDLSHVPPELVKLWVQQFKYEAARWRTDENTSLRKFALHLRTEISVLAEAFRITNEAVASMIKEGDTGK